MASVIAAVVAGAGLRGWMLHKFFEVSGDSRLYGGMARNLLLHGQYALTDGSGVVHPTLIRLPGYPLFLAACFRLFGMENYFAACVVQIAAALLGCWLLFLFVYRISPPRFRMAAAQGTLWLAALCPFTAVYDAEPLTEGLSVFCIALALWAVARFQDEAVARTQSPRESPVRSPFQGCAGLWTSALLFSFAVMYSALLRPDGALVGVVLAPPLLVALARRVRAGYPAKPLIRMAAAGLLIALAPFGVWTARNWRTFHVFEPLAPRYATDPGEDIWPGWQRWMKTWCLDFVSTYQVYWNVPGSPFDLSVLPRRAFDSPSQYAQTAKLAAEYEANGEEFSSEIDEGFAQLARQRIAADPVRYYLTLPAGRIADMWLRPRIENLPIDLDWWVYRHHYAETRFSWSYAGLNLLYLLLGGIGALRRPRLWTWMLLYMVLRSLLLATIEAPEARYTVECFPMVFALGGVAIGWMFHRLGKSRRPGFSA